MDNSYIVLPFSIKSEVVKTFIFRAVSDFILKIV